MTGNGTLTALNHFRHHTRSWPCKALGYSHVFFNVPPRFIAVTQTNSHPIKVEKRWGHRRDVPGTSLGINFSWFHFSLLVRFVKRFSVIH